MQLCFAEPIINCTKNFIPVKSYIINFLTAFDRVIVSANDCLLKLKQTQPHEHSYSVRLLHIISARWTVIFNHKQNIRYLIVIRYE